MKRTHQSGARIGFMVMSAALVAFAAPVSPEPAATTLIPAPGGASVAAICRTGDLGRPEPAWVRTSFENDNCSLPPEPPVLDGTKASRDQLMTGLAAAKKFAALADTYQQCISDYLVQRRQEAQRSGNPVTSAFVTIEAHRILASETSKKRVKARIAMAVDDFNAEGSECPQ